MYIYILYYIYILINIYYIFYIYIYISYFVTYIYILYTLYIYISQCILCIDQIQINVSPPGGTFWWPWATAMDDWPRYQGTRCCRKLSNVWPCWVAFAIFQAIMLWEYSLNFRPEIETLGMVGTANLGSWNGHGRNMDNITIWCNYCNIMTTNPANHWGHWK